MRNLVAAVGLSLVALATSSGTAQADGSGDTMYAVGTDIQPGTYRYTVTGHDWGDWELCRDANCAEHVAQSGVINGEGPHQIRVRLPPTGRTLNIGEQKRHNPRRSSTGHGIASAHFMCPSNPSDVAIAR